MNFLLHVKIASKSDFTVAVRLADGSFTTLSCHSMLLKHRSVLHHSDAMICHQESCFYCTFALHHGTHFRYL